MDPDQCHLPMLKVYFKTNQRYHLLMTQISFQELTNLSFFFFFPLGALCICS